MFMVKLVFTKSAHNYQYITNIIMITIKQNYVNNHHTANDHVTYCVIVSED